MTETRVRRTGWYVLVRWAAYGIIVAQGLVAALRTDKEAGLATLGFVVGLVVLRWRRLPGVILLGLQYANAAFWTVLATLSNITHGEGLVHTMIPAVIAVLSLVGLVSAIAELLIPPAPTARLRGPRFVAIGAAVLLVASLVGSFLGPSRASARSGDLRITTENVAFSTKKLDAPAGRVSVYAENKDLFWHTFSISKVGVDLKLPEGAHRRVEFEAQPGTYEFECKIPGHEQAGMKGTLVVR